jgi:23S rRNA pseudouridine1911/1915/1917 synthase
MAEWLSTLSEHDTEYRAYLEASLADISACHAGYFSQDNSDSDEDIAKEVETILHGKKHLLSFKNKDGSYNTLRFLFSKWTLKEGWDNPNVFTIAKLRSSGSENSKLQEVGRGLRLPVDENGNRISNEEFQLNYIVDFTEADFAKRLIDQINGEIPQASSISEERLEQVAKKLGMTSDELFDALYSFCIINSLSRTTVKNLIKEGRILVDGRACKSSYRPSEGQEILVEIPAPEQLETPAQNLPLHIIYQDGDLVVINKEKGMVVHPSPGHRDGTLVNALLYHIKDLSGINGDLRPGIVHRLDKDTSGVMVVAKNDAAHRSLAAQIKDHTINREYVALVHGVIKENLGTIDAPIGRSKLDRKKMAVVGNGRVAISNYQVLQRYRNYSLVKVKLLTGRTHQIRVHFAYIKHPVVGDPLYSSAKPHFNLDSQALHARLLGFVHPSSGMYMEFSSELPEYFQAIIRELEGEKI